MCVFAIVPIIFLMIEVKRHPGYYCSNAIKIGQFEMNNTNGDDDDIW